MVPRYRGRKWLRPAGTMQRWIDALLSIDRHADVKPLVALLKSNSPIPKDARWYVADLLERYQLKRKRGGKRTPAYDRSEAETWLIWAKEAVNQMTQDGTRKADAIERAARTYGVDSETLRSFLAGKHSSARRIAKRRPPRPAIRP